MLPHFGLQRAFLAIRNHDGANVSPALQDAHDCGFVLPACPCDAALAFADVHVPRFPADESFVSFHFAREQSESTICQSKAQTMRHEPCGLLSHAKIAG